ncbi:SDR family NAD(P)-dependent oxidoreductase [uncultured Desulfovibrio sp.]|uniref:SDR family NAD(P)-dependent oxidoreductase n=1 Tax=uncultured Desulfovibrio sp. TaxID=167968 RepID=UPI0026729003|nr:SDR family oxidoreductase [uncultured Desulfovibrio sp.]
MIGFAAEQLILVTGASSGLGRAIALLLNSLGATVIASGRNAARLEDVRQASAVPERCVTEQRDLAADLSGLPAWVADLRRRFGKLYGLAFCAGQTWNTPLQIYDAAQARQAFDLCCHAPLLVARGFCDRRNNAGPGANIVFLAAAAAVEPNQGQGMYGAAKAALVTAARCLSKEIAPRGLRVNCISPGLVDTPMMRATVEQLGEEFLERERGAYPLGLGMPEDVAHLAAFLLSDKARWLTGQNILLSGGR